MKSVIFGGNKGFGESILLQFEDDKYGIIDSFIDRKSGNPVVLDYLSSNNIDVAKIEFVVLTHYHQDHFTGVATILEKCKNAKFYTFDSFAIESFQALVALNLGLNSKHNYFSEYDKIVKLIKSSNRKIHILSDRSKPIINSSSVKIYALSPNDKTVIFLDNLYRKRFKEQSEGIVAKIQIGKDFNFQSVVIVVEINDNNILFGSDLEYSKSNKSIGWSAIYKNKKIAKKEFVIFKLPHHGSENGCNIKDWQRVIVENAYLKLTPYNRSKLPRATMIKKICSLSKNVYITSETKTKKIPSKFSKQLKGLAIEKL